MIFTSEKHAVERRSEVEQSFSSPSYAPYVYFVDLVFRAGEYGEFSEQQVDTCRDVLRIRHLPEDAAKKREQNVAQLKSFAKKTFGAPLRETTDFFDPAFHELEQRVIRLENNADSILGDLRYEFVDVEIDDVYVSVVRDSYNWGRILRSCPRGNSVSAPDLPEHVHLRILYRNLLTV